MTEREIETKRKAHEQIEKIFDPLGYVAPILVKFKVVIQDLWSKKLGWDSILQEEQTKRIMHITDQFKGQTITIPRFLASPNDVS